MTKTECRKVIKEAERKFPGLTLERMRARPGPDGFELRVDLAETCRAFDVEPTFAAQMEMDEIVKGALEELGF